MPTQPPNTLSSLALTTLDQVKLYLGKADLEAGADDRITWLINVASAAVTSYSQREYVSSFGTASTTRSFEVRGSPRNSFVSLAPYDAQSVTGVTLTDTAGNTSTVDRSFYQPGPVHKPNGVYIWLRLVTWQAPDMLVYNTNFSFIANITGVWGFPAVPVDVENAVIGTVCKWYQREQETPSPEFDLNPTFHDSSQGLNLPYEARVLLQSYKRPVGL
jgi:hypothetical protein